MSRRTIYYLLTLFGIFLTLSCVKDENDHFHFTFNNLGGPQVYEVDIDGASLAIEIDGRRSKPAHFGRDLADEKNSNWIVEWEDRFTDWIWVSYMPYWGERGQLYVLVHENTTGQRRSARVTADKHDGGQVIIDIKQNK